MAQETKVGLLIGLALILLVGLVLSDLFTHGSPETADAAASTGFGPEAQVGIYDAPPARPHTSAHAPDARSPGPADRFTPEPAQDYRPPVGPPAPLESWSPTPLDPPLPELNTEQARQPDALARFDASLEAMRLAIQTPAASDASDFSPTDAATAPAATESTNPDAPRAAAGMGYTASAGVVPEGNSGVTSGSSSGGGTSFIHYVQAGQSLTDIARQHYGNPEFARAIALTNADRLDTDGQARAGVRLEIPPLGAPVFSRLFEPVHRGHAVRIDPTELPQLPGRPAGPVAAETRLAAGTDAASTVVVQPGDTLSELASQHLGSAAQWEALLQANRDQLDSAESLRSGMTLRLPAADRRVATADPSPRPAARRTYTVRPGDNLTRIARAQLGDGDRWRELFTANADRLETPDDLFAGQTLRLP
ncbi:MAG: LysM peptidoglycan-binding domain-containing protein [Planctomycetota bacterium]